MKLYLSSYRLGNHTAELQRLIGKADAKVAVSTNARDSSDDKLYLTSSLAQEIADIESLGYTAEAFDLRDYFDNDRLVKDLSRYDAVWLSGGNTFILAKAFQQSGFQQAFDQLIKIDRLVYAGYSAAFAVLAPSLRGVELVDDVNATADSYRPGELWDGLGIIDFYPIVHFRSDHHESDDVEKEYRYVVENNLAHKTFRDGDVYLVNGSSARTLS